MATTGEEDGSACFACFFFFLGAVTNHTGDHGVVLNQQAESPSLFARSGIIWYTRSGRSQASKSPDQRLRLTWSLSSDKAEFERAGRNLIPDERAPKPDVLALWNLKGTKCSWSYRQEPRQGWGRGEQRLSGCGLKPLT